MRYLEEISKEYNVDWVNTETEVTTGTGIDGIFSDEEGSRLRGLAPMGTPTGRFLLSSSPFILSLHLFSSSYLFFRTSEYFS